MSNKHKLSCIYSVDLSDEEVSDDCTGCTPREYMNAIGVISLSSDSDSGSGSDSIDRHSYRNID